MELWDGDVLGTITGTYTNPSDYCQPPPPGCPRAAVCDHSPIPVSQLQICTPQKLWLCITNLLFSEIMEVKTVRHSGM